MTAITSLQDERYQLKKALRRELLDELILLGSIEGKLELPEFLKRTWDLDNMPSIDGRFKTATADVWQHMVNNYDWDELYLYGTYLELFDAPDTVFLKFIEECTHPMVRKPGEQEKYVATINKYLTRDGFKLQVREEIAGYKVYRAVGIGSGVIGKVKNLVFAANGPKPHIVLADAVNNDIQIVKNAQYCLVYDLPIPHTGLMWADLVAWWATSKGAPKPSIEIERDLYKRLRSSLDPKSKPEKLLFDAYYKAFHNDLGEKLPALIPQVYLHYDPYTFKTLEGVKRIPRQRMDFLILFSNHERVVIEVDGKQHYADGTAEGAAASPQKYAEMVAADRELRLAGYEVYRFGGYELTDENTHVIGKAFFRKLMKKHNIM